MNPNLITEYFKKFVHYIPGCLESYDTSRVIILQFALSGLDLLNRIDDVFSEDEKRELIDWIYDLQILNTTSNKLEGFRGGYYPETGRVTNQDYMSCHVTMAYSCLVCLTILGDDLSRIDKPGLLTSFSKLQNRSDGCFYAALDCPEADVRFIFSVFASCAMLNDFSTIDIGAAVSFILNCQNYDGGFGQRPREESHGGSTYCALASLSLVSRLDLCFPRDGPERALMLRWLINRQNEGFHGRPHKDDDSCYTFWIGASLKMLGYAHLVDFPSLLNFIESTYDNSIGGFCKLKKTRHSFADPMHTYLCLAGISCLLGDCRANSDSGSGLFRTISMGTNQLIDVIRPIDPSIIVRRKSSEGNDICNLSSDIQSINELSNLKL